MAGLCRVGCSASGGVWVGRARTLETIKNRVWFSRRQGSHTCRSLQAAWTTHGEAGLAVGECGRLEDEETNYVRTALLRERWLYWRSELKAEAIRRTPRRRRILRGPRTSSPCAPARPR